MNLLQTLGTAAGAIYGGPEGAAIGSQIGGALGGGGGNTAGGYATNGTQGLSSLALAGAFANSTAQQTANEIGTMNFQNGLMWQNSQFNNITDAHSQEMQQVNTLRDVAMQQRKADDSITKEFVQTIKQ